MASVARVILDELVMIIINRLFALLNITLSSCSGANGYTTSMGEIFEVTLKEKKEMMIKSDNFCRFHTEDL